MQTQAVQQLSCGISQLQKFMARCVARTRANSSCMLQASISYDSRGLPSHHSFIKLHHQEIQAQRTAEPWKSYPGKTRWLSSKYRLCLYVLMCVRLCDTSAAKLKSCDLDKQQRYMPERSMQNNLILLECWLQECHSRPQVQLPSRAATKWSHFICVGAGEGASCMLLELWIYYHFCSGHTTMY
jgi:hypothetical protein